MRTKNPETQFMSSLRLRNDIIWRMSFVQQVVRKYQIHEFSLKNLFEKFQLFALFYKSHFNALESRVNSFSPTRPQPLRTSPGASPNIPTVRNASGDHLAKLILEKYLYPQMNSYRYK